MLLMLQRIATQLIGSHTLAYLTYVALPVMIQAMLKLSYISHASAHLALSTTPHQKHRCASVSIRQLLQVMQAYCMLV